MRWCQRSARMSPLLLPLTLMFTCACAASALPRWHGKWFSSDGPPRAVALLIHGLNLKPEKMDPLARVLASADIEVLRLSLSGHGYGSLKDVTASSWLKQSQAGYRAVAKRAKELGVAVYFVGYSLGGLLGEALLAQSSPVNPVRFDRVVLLAPAIALRPVVYLVKVLFLFGRGFALPSADKPAYRAHAATTMAAYEALFGLLGIVRAGRYQNANVPTLVFVRRNDELVSLSGLRSIVRKHGLTNWAISQIPGPGVPGYPHHLIIDERSLGATNWGWLKASILRQLPAVRP